MLGIVVLTRVKFSRQSNILYDSIGLFIRLWRGRNWWIQNYVMSSFLSIEFVFLSIYWNKRMPLINVLIGQAVKCFSEWTQLQIFLTFNICYSFIVSFSLSRWEVQIPDVCVIDSSHLLMTWYHRYTSLFRNNLVKIIEWRRHSAKTSLLVMWLIPKRA